MKRNLQWLAGLAFAMLAAAPALASAASPVGSWQITTGEARYSVTACGEDGALLCARLIWLRADQRTDENLALLNTYVVRGAQPVAANQWAGNVVLDGRTYAGKVTLQSRNFMTLKGCSGIMCQTYQFTRI
jgi:uncharacterized protein (DUF2147 family)